MKLLLASAAGAEADALEDVVDQRPDAAGAKPALANKQHSRALRETREERLGVIQQAVSHSQHAAETPVKSPPFTSAHIHFVSTSEKKTRSPIFFWVC